MQRTYFGKAIPNLPMGRDMRELFADELASGRWERVAVPAHGDAALLRGGDYPHVGVWLVCDGVEGVLHALEGVGVIWTPAPALRMLGFSRVRFVRFLEPICAL